MKKPRWHSIQNEDVALSRNLRLSIHNKEIPWGYIMNRFEIQPRADHYNCYNWIIVMDTKIRKKLINTSQKKEETCGTRQ